MENKTRRLKIFAMLMRLQEIEQEALKTEINRIKTIKYRPRFKELIKFEPVPEFKGLQSEFYEIPKSKFYEKPKNNFKRK